MNENSNYGNLWSSSLNENNSNNSRNLEFDCYGNLNAGNYWDRYYGLCVLGVKSQS